MRIVEVFRERGVRKVARLGVPVALGKFAASLAGLGTLALLARHLGPRMFGAVALIRTAGNVIAQYTDFNSWLAIIKYGTEAIAQGRTTDVKRILKLAFLIDFLTSVLGLAVCIVVAAALPSLFHLSEHEAVAFAWYGITLLPRFGGTDGAYRIFDASRAQAIVTSIAALGVMIGAGTAVLLHAGFDGCLIAVGIAESVGNLAIFFVAAWVIRANGYGGWARAPLRGVTTTFPGIRRFLLSTNGQLTVKKSSGELDMFLVAGFLGEAEAGLLRVIKQVSMIPGRVFMPFEQILFTELARHVAVRDYAGFRAALRRFKIIVAAGGLAIAVVGAAGSTLIVRIVAGSAYLAAAPALGGYLLGMAIGVIAAPTQRALVALGRPGTLFWFEVATLVLFVVAGVIGTMTWGLMGLTGAFVLHKLVQLAWSSWFVARISRDLETNPPPATVEAVA